jgi:hypothetical protein
LTFHSWEEIRREKIVERKKKLKIFCALTHKKTPWPQSASELYRPSDHRLSAKLVYPYKIEMVLEAKKNAWS